MKRRRNPEGILLETLAEPVSTAANAAGDMIARMINPAPLSPVRLGRKKKSFRRLLAEGSQLLQELSAQDSFVRDDGGDCWDRMTIAFESGTEADQRTALTCLQIKLWEWTADDADVAGNDRVQRFRKALTWSLDL